MNKLLATLVFACVSTAAMAQAGTTAPTMTTPAADTAAPAAKPEHKDHKKHKAEHSTTKASKEKKADAAAEGTGMTPPADAHKMEGKEMHEKHKGMHGKHKPDAAAPAGAPSAEPMSTTPPAK